MIGSCFGGVNAAARLTPSILLGQADRAAENLSRLFDYRWNHAPEPDQLAQAFRLRGAHFARTGEWKLATADYAENASLGPKANSIDWMMAAAVGAYATEGDQHRLHCRNMAARFGESTVASDMERRVKASLLLEERDVRMTRGWPSSSRESRRQKMLAC